MRLIDADAFKKYIADGIDGLILPTDQVKKAIAITRSFLKDIDEQPTIEARPHGEWIDKGEYAECSLCGSCSGTQFDGVEPIPLKTNFCPNCGASMRVKNELNRVSKELNSETEKSKSEIVPDYRDGWRLREGDEK